MLTFAPFNLLPSRTALLAAALFTVAGPAHAQTAYPQRPVQVIAGFSAGGSVDVMARNLAAVLSA